MREIRFSNIVILLGGVGCLAIVIYVLTRFGERAQDQWSVLIYVVVPLVLASGFFISLGLSAELRVKLALTIVGLGLGVVAAEAYLWLFGPPRTHLEARLEAAEAWGFPPDNRSVIDVIHDLEKDGRAAIPHFISWKVLVRGSDGKMHSSIHIDGREILPLSGVSLERTVACNEMGYWMIYDADEHGFRNPKGLWKPGNVDIVLLGDSFAYGACVRLEEHFSSIIRQRFPKTWNLGFPNLGPVGTYATLVEYARPLRPKKVVWFFFEGNDMGDLDNELAVPLLMRYLKGDYLQQLFELQGEIDAEINRFIREQRKSLERQPKPPTIPKIIEFFFFRKVRIALNLPSFTEAGRVPIRDTKRRPNLSGILERTLTKAKKAVESWGGKLYLVYLPAWRRGRDTNDTIDYLKQVKRLIEAVAERLQLSFIDVVPPFMAHPEPRRLTAYPSAARGSHYSHIGYGVVADVVLNYLLKEIPDRLH